MQQTPQRDLFCQLVSFSKFDKSITKVVDRTFKLLNRDQSKYSFPTLIGIEIEYDGRESTLPCIRGFLNRLRSIHQKHFVRFVTDSLWAMETENGDIFYTNDGPKNEWSDVVWSIKVKSDSQVEILPKIVVNPARAKFLQDVTTLTRRFVPVADADKSFDYLKKMLTHYCKKNTLVNQISTINEPLHILFIPNRGKTGFWTVPLYGMNYFDAKRRSVMAGRVLENKHRNYFELFTCVANDAGIFDTYIDLIRSTDKFGQDPKFLQDTYNLSEMLFSTYAASKQFDESHHDIVLFDPHDDGNFTVDIYRYGIRDLTDIN